MKNRYDIESIIKLFLHTSLATIYSNKERCISAKCKQGPHFITITFTSQYVSPKRYPITRFNYDANRESGEMATIERTDPASKTAQRDDVC